ncbi:MAG: Clp protease N-terminal domain-containing protein [Hyphomicrobiaceae bacterium]
MSRTAPSAPEGGAIAKSAQLTACLEKAHRLAVEGGHSMVTLEHVLMSLLGDGEALGVLSASTVDPEKLRADIGAHLSRLPRDGAPGAAIMPNNDLLKVLRLASMAAQQSARRQIDGAIVLAAIIGDGTTPSAALLKTHGLTFNEVIRVLQGVAKPAAPPPPPPPPAAATVEKAVVQAPVVRAAVDTAPVVKTGPIHQAAPVVVAHETVGAHVTMPPPNAHVTPQTAGRAEPKFEAVTPPVVPGAASITPTLEQAVPMQRQQSTDELLASVRARLKDVVPPTVPKVAGSKVSASVSRAVEPVLPTPEITPVATETLVPSMQEARVEPSFASILPEHDTVVSAADTAVDVARDLKSGPTNIDRDKADKVGSLDQALAQVKAESSLGLDVQELPAPPSLQGRPASPPLSPPPVPLARRDGRDMAAPPSAGSGALSDIPTLQPRNAPPPLPKTPIASGAVSSNVPQPPQNGGRGESALPSGPKLVVAASGPGPAPSVGGGGGQMQLMPPLPQLPAPQIDLAAVADELPVDVAKGIATTVEVLLPRRAFELQMPPQAPRMPFWPPVRAVTVKLYSSGAGVSVEPVSAETQFVRVWRGAGESDSVAWRWKVMPHGNGPIGLTLALGVRNISMEGVGPELWWPEETVGVSVGGGKRSGKKVLLWSVLVSMLAGGIAALVWTGKAGPVLAWAMNTVRKLVGG